MAGGSFKSAKLDQGRQLVHTASLGEINSSSPEFFGFAPRQDTVEDMAGQAEETVPWPSHLSPALPPNFSASFGGQLQVL